MKSFFIPIAFQYKAGESVYKDTIGFTNKEVADVMLAIYEVKRLPENEDKYIADILMEMVERKEVPDRVLVYFMCHGVGELYDLFRPGLSLLRESEEKDDKEAAGD